MDASAPSTLVVPPPRPTPNREDTDENSLWQFAMKLSQPPPNAVQDKRGFSRPGYRCLACQWVVQASAQSISSMRYHFAHAKGRKACVKVTQHIINRLKAMPGNKGGVLDLSEMRRGKKRRKKPSAATSEGGMDARAVFQKLKSAHHLSLDVLTLLGRDASVPIDRATLLTKVVEQEGILQQLKQEFQMAASEKGEIAAPEAPAAPAVPETDDEYNELLANLSNLNEVPDDWL